jgi:hypothetical protein
MFTEQFFDTLPDFGVDLKVKEVEIYLKTSEADIYVELREN